MNLGESRTPEAFVPLSLRRITNRLAWFMYESQRAPGDSGLISRARFCWSGRNHEGEPFVAYGSVGARVSVSCRTPYTCGNTPQTEVFLFPRCSAVPRVDGICLEILGIHWDLYDPSLECLI